MQMRFALTVRGALAASAKYQLCDVVYLMSLTSHGEAELDALRAMRSSLSADRRARCVSKPLSGDL